MATQMSRKLKVGTIVDKALAVFGTEREARADLTSLPLPR
jgi:hypothetical protein